MTNSMKLKSLLVKSAWVGLMVCQGMAATAMAAELNIACGSNAFEGLRQGDNRVPGLILTLEEQGGNKAPVVINFRNREDYLSDQATVAKFKQDPASATISAQILVGSYRFRFEQIRNCDDLANSSGQAFLEEKATEHFSEVDYKPIAGPVECFCREGMLTGKAAF
jgi:hypothetical protein